MDCTSNFPVAGQTVLPPEPMENVQSQTSEAWEGREGSGRGRDYSHEF